MRSAFSRILPFCGVFALASAATAVSVFGNARPVFGQTDQPTEAVRIAQVAQPPASSAIIGDYWKRVYGEGGVEAPRPGDLAPASPSSSGGLDGFRDFLDHLTFRFGATYTRNIVQFTGQPTSTFVINDGAPLTVTRNGFSFPQVFQAGDNEIYSYLVLGTTGYGDPRLNTYFSMIYRQNVDGLTEGSPFQNILNTFTDGRRTQVLNGWAEWNGFGTGALAHTSLRVGRQYAFETTPDLLGSPIFDGAALTHRDSRLELAGFAGRHVDLFGDQEADFTMGGSASYKFLPTTSANVNYVFLPGIHRYAFNLNHQIGEVHTGSFLTFRNDHPIELGTRAWYSPPSSPWTIRGTLFRQLTSDDFTYDMFADREPPTGKTEQLRRLLLRKIRPATQLGLDVDRQFNSWLTLGAGVAARFVDGGEAPFDNSFEQVALRATLTPFDRFDFLFQYRYRHVERSKLSDVLRATTFDDITHAGETNYHEVNGEIYYHFGSRVSARVGGYFGLFDSRDRLAEVTGVITAGAYVRAKVHVTRLLDLRLEYGIDRGNPEFNPDIKLQHTIRAGFDFHY